MAFSISSVALLGFLLLIISRIAYKILAKRARTAEANRRGCLPARKLPPKGFLGVGRLRESMRATKEERGPQYVAETMDDVGVHTLAVPILDYELLVTRDPENVKAMLSSGDFDISATRQKSWWPLMGRGVFTARGQDWKHSRSLVRPQFARAQVQDVALFEPHVEALLRKLPTLKDGWTGKVDLSPLFYNFTIDSITEFLYGQSVHTQDPDARARLPLSWDKNGPDLVNFGHHIDQCKEYIDRKGALAKYQWLMSSKAFNGHCAEVQKFVDYFVQQKLTAMRHGDDEKTLESPLAGGKRRLVLLDELAKETQDPTTLRSETLHIMIAGRDTSAALLGWVFYFLARHPAAFARLRAEAVRMFGTVPSDVLNFNTLWQFAYLHHCIDESLRVAAVIPMNERSALRDTTLPRGGGVDGLAPVFIPKGNQVLIPLYAMQHRKDIWGDDVGEWNPERWNERKVGWEFVPFGGGPRQCLGRKCFLSIFSTLCKDSMLTIMFQNGLVVRRSCTQSCGCCRNLMVLRTWRCRVRLNSTTALKTAVAPASRSECVLHRRLHYQRRAPKLKRSTLGLELREGSLLAKSWVIWVDFKILG